MGNEVWEPTGPDSSSSIGGVENSGGGPQKGYLVL